MLSGPEVDKSVGGWGETFTFSVDVLAGATAAAMSTLDSQRVGES